MSSGIPDLSTVPAVQLQADRPAATAQTQPSQPNVVQNLLKDSAHPTACIMHLVFKLAALITYLFGQIIFSAAVVFILVLVLAASDFWTTQNVTGRLLVGLRWKNVVEEDGREEWKYEMFIENSQVNKTDKWVFWGGMFVFVASWIIFFITRLFTFDAFWMLCCGINIGLLGVNIQGYMKCNTKFQEELKNAVKSTTISATISSAPNFLGGMLNRGTSSNQVNFKMLNVIQRGFKEIIEKHIQSDSEDPDNKKPAPAIKEDKVPSLFGESDESDTEPFFLEDAGSVQYIYRPKTPLEFSDSGWASIWSKAKPRSKIWSCRSAFSSFLLAGIAISQPHLYSVATMAVFLGVPFLISARGKVLRDVSLNRDGETLKFEYKKNKFSPIKDQTFEIAKLPEPKGDKIFFWKVYEFPDDLKTFIEKDKLQSVTWIKKYGSRYNFFLFDKDPSYVNREVLVNALNRVQIDTDATESIEGDDIKDRYFIKED